MHFKIFALCFIFASTSFAADESTGNSVVARKVVDVNDPEISRITEAPISDVVEKGSRDESPSIEVSEIELDLAEMNSIEALESLHTDTPIDMRDLVDSVLVPINSKLDVANEIEVPSSELLAPQHEADLAVYGSTQYRWPHRFQEHAQYFAELLGLNDQSFENWAGRVLDRNLRGIISGDEILELKRQLEQKYEPQFISQEAEDLAIEILISELPHSPELSGNTRSFFKSDRIYYLLMHPMDAQNPKFKTARRLVRSVEYRKDPTHFMEVMLGGLQKQFKIETPATEAELIRLKVREEDLYRLEKDLAVRAYKLRELNEEMAKLVNRQSPTMNGPIMNARREMIETMEDQIFADGYEGQPIKWAPLELLMKLTHGGKSPLTGEVKTWLTLLATKHLQVLRFVLFKALNYSEHTRSEQLIAREILRVLSEKNPAALILLQNQLEAEKKATLPIHMKEVNEKLHFVRTVARQHQAAACMRALTSGEGNRDANIRRLGPGKPSDQ
jgi:hypothetical protein